MIEPGTVEVTISNHIATMNFSHPKGNSLPGTLLREMARQMTMLGQNADVRVIVLRSSGDKVFCGGASFDELVAVKTADEAHEFFMGFALLILAMRDCPKFIVARVQGKVVGGGVGLVSAADYVLATEASPIRLSELALGLGPFVIGPAVQRKIGLPAFSTMAIDADWHDADRAKDLGLYSRVYPTIDALDEATTQFAQTLARSNPDAMSRLKHVLWEGTESWAQLLPQRARISSELVVTDFVRSAIAKVQQR